MKTSLSDIQKKIADYMGDDDSPSKFNLRCFAGMIQTGEATLSDFLEVDHTGKLMDSVADYVAGEGWRNT